jgi:hypothetical protein
MGGINVAQICKTSDIHFHASTSNRPPPHDNHHSVKIPQMTRNRQMTLLWRMCSFFWIYISHPGITTVICVTKAMPFVRSAIAAALLLRHNHSPLKPTAVTTSLAITASQVFEHLNNLSAH